MQGLEPSDWKKTKRTVALIRVMTPEPRVVIRSAREHPEKVRRSALHLCGGDGEATPIRNAAQFLLQARGKPDGA